MKEYITPIDDMSNYDIIYDDRTYMEDYDNITEVDIIDIGYYVNDFDVEE